MSRASAGRPRRSCLQLGPGSLANPTSENSHSCTSGHRSSGRADLELGPLMCPITAHTGSTGE
ncbi:hypothetical protein Taro_007888, partial [Colocasia esculenta]|nr:hypothetical protein [Colocasia esculenta]